MGVENERAKSHSPPQGVEMETFSFLTMQYFLQLSGSSQTQTLVIYKMDKTTFPHGLGDLMNNHNSEAKPEKCLC